MKVLYGKECADTSTFQHLAAHVPDGKSDQVSLNLSNKQRSRRAHYELHMTKITLRKLKTKL
jgi:hypothetical protein